METAIWVLWGLWMLQAAVCVYNIWIYPYFLTRQDREFAEAANLPSRDRAVVIVPIKGLSPFTAEFLENLFHQDHPDYRLLFCFESDDDPAATFLRKELALGPAENTTNLPEEKRSPGLREIHLVSAGVSTDCGQKVHNQRAAMQLVEPGDRIIAFADADMLCGRDWLSRLIAPLELGAYDLMGGYRWFIPDRPGFVTSLASVMNASVATLGGRDFYNMLWGGSMALTRKVYDEMDVPEHFRGSLNDDLHLAREARVAGYRIGYRRSLMIPSPVSFSLSSLVEFARRQYYQDRHHSPKIYTGANILLWLYPIAWCSSLGAALSGNTAAWIPWLTVNLLFDQARAFGRARLIHRLFDPATVKKLRLARLLEHIATPLWMTMHAFFATSALAMTRITWAGTTYRIRERRRTEILSREKTPTG